MSRFAIARIVAAVLLVVTGANHARLAATHQGDVFRHWLFVAIDLVVPALLVKAPRVALVPIAVLALQQTYSHGADLVESLGPGSAGVDWASVGVVLFFPALVTLLVVERRASTSARRAGEPPRS